MSEIKIDKTFVVNDLMAFCIPYCVGWMVAFQTHWAVSPVILNVHDDVFVAVKIDFLPYYLNFHAWMALLAVALKAFGLKFVVRERPIKLKRKPFKDTIEAFISKTMLMYIGIVDHYGPSIRNVMYPYDFFMDNLMRKFCEEERKYAVEVYKRTNSTLPLRLAQADKFAKLNPLGDGALLGLTDVYFELMTAITRSHGFEAFARRVKVSVTGRFEDVTFDNTSAAGYPYRSGVKKGDVYDDAKEVANCLLRNENDFSLYLSDHVWYTTGRAKLQDVQAEPSARIICYPGFASMLLGSLYFQPWQRMLEMMDWCAVGMSWTDCGARKFAEYFDDFEGTAPPGFRYVSLDISGFDNSVGAPFLGVIRDFHINLLRRCGAAAGYVSRMVGLYNDMINGIIVFPFGYAFRTASGMKSGWPNTSHDDTLIHYGVIRRFQRLTRTPFRFKVYGDDNFMLIPDSITDDQIIDSYAECGFKVRDFKSSRLLSDVPFLSKRVRFSCGDYYVYRDNVETFARLLMPEENDPGNREVPDEIAAAERLVGHLLDNPFNTTVNEKIYEMLRHLRDHYRIYNVDITEYMRKHLRWKNVDVQRLTNVPIIPRMDFICALYGVHDRKLDMEWPSFDGYHTKFDFCEQDQNAIPFYDAQRSHFDVWNRVLDLNKKNRKICAKSTSPFVAIGRSYNVRGFHAARLEWAIKNFEINFREVLDFGTHPGACAHALLRRDGAKVLGVSLIPSFDAKRPVPYVLRSDNFEFVEMDANDYAPDRKFDLIHDDIDIVSVRSEVDRLETALSAIRRFKKLAEFTNSALMTASEFNDELIDEIYECYRIFGGFEIGKPLFSNPWKPEYMLYFKKQKKPIIRKTVFKRAIFAFLNRFSSQIHHWSLLLLQNVQRLEIGKEAIRCPLQLDDDVQKKFIVQIL
jgi:hypothetical protein